MTTAKTKPETASNGKPKIVATYDYTDEAGVLLFQVARYEPGFEGEKKTFRQRRPDRRGGWINGLGDTPRVLYRLHELLQASADQLVFLVEGEGKVEALRGIGCIGTTCAMGAGKWKSEYQEALRGRHVIVLPDCDAPGRKHAQVVADSLRGVAASVLVVELPGLPPKGDVVDWLRTPGNGKLELVQEVERAARSERRPGLPGAHNHAANGDGGQAYASAGEDGPDEDGRPQLLITTEEWQVNDAAVQALTAEPNLFERGNTLVAIQRDQAKVKLIDRKEGSPRIVPVVPARLRELLSQRVSWLKAKRTRKGDYEHVPAHPPEWAVAGILSRGSWPEIRHLTAVIEAPVLRADGTVLDRPGWDPATGLLYEPAADFPRVPECPLREDAVAAADHLLDLVIDFPFAGPPHKAAWLSALLTPFGRYAISGPCPLFAFDASTPGSGKTLLCDLIAILLTGRQIARVCYNGDDAEMRKVITAVALAGDVMVLLDNVAGEFGNPALDAVLTGTEWRDRLLGRSEMTPELPLYTIWMATANNLVLRGDIIRRIVGCRLEPHEERPEERDKFVIPRLLEHVHLNRPTLVTAALTILRAYAAAGRPRGKDNGKDIPAYGGFEAWSGLVRGAVHWTLGLDPCATREALRVGDTQAAALAALLEGWNELPGAERGLTTAEMLRFVKADPERVQRLHDALMEWSRTGELPTPRAIGNRLRQVRDRVANGKVLRGHENRDGVMAWRLESAAT